MSRGAVDELFRWPVKSLGGERLPAVELRADGVAGDRRCAVLDSEDRVAPLSARRSPKLLRWSSGYPRLDPDRAGPVVDSPAGTRYSWGDPALPAALGADLGRPVRLTAAGRNHDEPGTVLVTSAATRAAVEAALGGELDVRRFRPNVHLDLDVAPYAEEDWTGRRLVFEGGAVLRLLAPCERCIVTTRDPDRPERRRPEVLRWLQLNRGAVFGIRAAVERPAALSRGERVACEPADD